MRVFSGIQATGAKHIGNYIGAMRQYVSTQETGDAFFCIVYLHSITVEYDPQELHDRTLDLAALLFAVGLEPELVEAATIARMRGNAADVVPNADVALWHDNAEFFHRGTSGQWRSLLEDANDLARYDTRVSHLVVLGPEGAATSVDVPEFDGLNVVSPLAVTNVNA